MPIKYIREANVKLIEHGYLLKINKQQDSIINLNNKYINEQKFIIKDFQSRVLDISEKNIKLNDQLNKQKSANKLLTGISVGAIIVSIVSLLVK